jgi:hypothetical protein
MELDVLRAVSSKLPGDTRDYRVLAWSRGPLADKDFEDIFQRLRTGTMAENNTSASAGPPRYTFGAMRSPRDGGLWLVAILQTLTDHRDSESTGRRRIAARTCLCVPFPAAAAIGFGFAEFATVFPPLDPAAAPPEGELPALPATLAPPQAAKGAIVETVDRLGFDSCAAVAALLLETRVALLDDVPGDVDERLARLDAVAALLPYGARAELSASTWVHSATPHTIRIGYTTGATVDQLAIRNIADAASSLKMGRAAREYYDALMRMKRHYSALEIIEHLGQQRDALSFAEPGRFVRTLDGLDRVFQVAVAARGGRASADEIRALFAAGAATKLPEADRRAMLAAWMSSPVPIDPDLVQQHWQGALWGDLCQAAADHLRRPPTDKAVLHSLIQLAERLGRPAELFESLLNRKAEPPVLEASLQATFDLLWGCRAAFAGDQGARLRRFFGSDLAMAMAFALYLVEQTSRPAHLAKWVRWLETDSRATDQGALDAFRIAAGLEVVDATIDTMRAAARVGARYPTALFAFAAGDAGAYPERLERLLPGFTAWVLHDVIERGNPGWRDRRDGIRQAIAALPLRRPSEILQARLDLLSLAVAGDAAPRLYLSGFLSVNRSVRLYAGELQKQLPALSGPRFDLPAALARQLSAMDNASQDRAEGILEVLDVLAARAETPSARDAISGCAVRQIETHPHLLRPERMGLLPRDYTPRMRELAMRAAMASGASIASVAESTATLLVANGENTDPVVELIGDTGYFQQVDTWQRFMFELNNALLRAKVRPDAIQHIERKLIVGALHGRGTDGFAAEYARHLKEQVLADAARISMILPLLAQSRARGAAFDDVDRRRLESELNAAREVLNRSSWKFW